MKKRPGMALFKKQFDYLSIFGGLMVNVLTSSSEDPRLNHSHIKTSSVGETNLSFNFIAKTIRGWRLRKGHYKIRKSQDKIRLGRKKLQIRCDEDTPIPSGQPIGTNLTTLCLIN